MPRMGHMVLGVQSDVHGRQTTTSTACRRRVRPTNVQNQRGNLGDYPHNTFLVATSIQCPFKLSSFGCRPWLPLLQRAEQGKVPMQRAKTHDNISSRIYQLMVVSIVFSSNIWPKGAGGGRIVHSSNLMRCLCSSCARSTHFQKASSYAV